MKRFTDTEIIDVAHLQRTYLPCKTVVIQIKRSAILGIQELSFLLNITGYIDFMKNVCCTLLQGTV